MPSETLANFFGDIFGWHKWGGVLLVSDGWGRDPTVRRTAPSQQRITPFKMLMDR